MKKSLLSIGIFAVLLVGGISVYIRSQKPESTTNLMREETTLIKKDNSMMENNQESKDKIMENEDSMMLDDQRYKEYSKELFNNTSNAKRILFFYANWCPTCIPADTNFIKNSSQIPSDVTVFRVNYNDPETDADEKALAQKYGITYQHTFVQIDSKGKEVTKWNGGQIENLLTNIK